MTVFWRKLRIMTWVTSRRGSTPSRLTTDLALCKLDDRHPSESWLKWLLLATACGPELLIFVPRAAHGRRFKAMA